MNHNQGSLSPKQHSSGKKPYTASASRGKKAAFNETPRKRRPFQATWKSTSSAQLQTAPVPTVPGFAEFQFDDRLIRAIHAAGYEIPTPIQKQAIPVALSGQDLIGTAQTGTGKTAAFVLPILQSLLKKAVPVRCPRVLVLTPTRELAEQVHHCFRELGRFAKIRSVAIYGGVPMPPQVRALRNGVDVIVACPGRLIDLLDRGYMSLSSIEHLVLDEADHMLDMGFLPSVKQILSVLPEERQTMLFSATIDPNISFLAQMALKNAKLLAVDLCAPAKTVSHALYPCEQHLKMSLLLRLLQRVDNDSVLIFTRTRHRADHVSSHLGRAGYVVAALHSDKTQSQRQTALESFRSGRCQILVATDIAARGLDVAGIAHVINFDIPDTADTYIHRIGRTGRAEREGDAMTLVTDKDRLIIRDIEKALEKSIERCRLDDFDYAVPRPASDRPKSSTNAHRGRSFKKATSSKRSA